MGLGKLLIASLAVIVITSIVGGFGLAIIATGIWSGNVPAVYRIFFFLGLFLVAFIIFLFLFLSHRSSKKVEGNEDTSLDFQLKKVPFVEKLIPMVFAILFVSINFLANSRLTLLDLFIFIHLCLISVSLFVSKRLVKTIAYALSLFSLLGLIPLVILTPYQSVIHFGIILVALDWIYFIIVFYWLTRFHRALKTPKAASKDITVDTQ